MRVTGVLKHFGNKRYINATNIRPAKDPHELYFHLQEVVYVTLVHQRGPVSIVLLLISRFWLIFKLKSRSLLALVMLADRMEQMHQSTVFQTQIILSTHHLPQLPPMTNMWESHHLRAASWSISILNRRLRKVYTLPPSLGRLKRMLGL